MPLEQILQSEMLRDSRLREPHNFINESPYFFRMADRANRCGLASFDWISSLDRQRIGNPHVCV